MGIFRKTDMKTKTRSEKKAMEVVELRVAELVPHALNREFARKGRKWEEFVESVRKEGRVLVPLHVWEQEDGSPVILAGHRRQAAAVACGLEVVPGFLHQMDEAEALAFLVNENLQREELDAVDEARLVAAMRDELKFSEMEIAERISRSVEWVRTRQMMLALGDEVLFAVRDPHPDRHLSLGAVEHLIRVPEEWREEAVQLVLHPEFDVRPLGPEAARDVIRKCVLEPRTAERAWNEGLPKVVEEWRKRLKGQLTKEEVDGFQVKGIEWSEAESALRGTVAAEDVVAEVEKAEAAPANLTWLRMAARVGLAVKILPDGPAGESQARVDARLIRLSEQALAEHGGTPWLVVDGKEKTVPTRTEAALSVLDGGGEVMWQDDEKTEGPPEGGEMEHHAWCDLTVVKRVAMWAVSADADPKAAPEWVPKWAVEMAFEGDWPRIDAVVNWVMTLKAAK